MSDVTDKEIMTYKYVANKSEICNYTDDNTFYSSDKTSQIIWDLSNDFETLTKWFYDNYTLLNPDKCHFIESSFLKSKH